MKKGRDARFSCKRCGNAGTRIRHLHFFYSTPCLSPQILHNLCFLFLLGITLVPRETEFLLEKRRGAYQIFLRQNVGSYLRAAFISLKAGRKTRTVLTMVLLRSNPALQTPHYHGQFALSLGKESPYILSKFNPLNTDTFSGPLKGPINGV